MSSARCGGRRTDLHDLAERQPGRITIETIDIDEPAQIAALHERLAGQRLNMLFVNAGTTTQDEHVRGARASTALSTDGG